MAKLKPNTLFGILCNDRRKVAPSLRRSLRKHIPNSEVLPLRVTQKFLKNTAACMKLVEFAGLVIDCEYKDSIWKYLPDLTPEAKAGRTVDVIEKSGKKILGHNTIGEAGASWASDNTQMGKTPKTALIVGDAPELKALVGGLLATGWKVAQLSLMGNKRPPLPKGASRITNTSSIPTNTQLIVTGTLTKKSAQALICIINGLKNIKSAINLQKNANIPHFKRIKTLSRRKLAILVMNTRVDILTSQNNG